MILLVLVCFEIEKRYELHFFEIGIDKDPVHFLLQWVGMKSPTQNNKDVKKYYSKRIISITSRNQETIVGRFLLVKWIFFVTTVSKFGDESTISKYVRDQGMDYEVLHKSNFIWEMV